MNYHCEESRQGWDDEAILTVQRLLRPDFIGTRNDNMDFFSAFATVSPFFTGSYLYRLKLFMKAVTSSKLGIPALPPSFLHFMAAVAQANCAIFFKSHFFKSPYMKAP
jgi:hypothetical protein